MKSSSAERIAARTAALERAKISWPEQLPIAQRAGELIDIWRQNQVIIVVGETGSGKTTQLPKMAIELGCGRKARIGCTQPRRIAAAAMARRVAQELEVEDDLTVGCQVRFDDRTAAETAVKFMTDGILLAETLHDRELRNYDAIIIDEAHERGLNIDFLLGYILRILPQRPDLKVAIASATLEAERFSGFFNNAPIIQVEGRSYPIEDIFMPPLEDEELPESVARAVAEMDKVIPRSDLLVFLPGEREIRECADLLNGRKLPNTEILPLYARLGRAEQQKIFSPGRARRIVLATNVAETSITIPRIGGVIDSGLARVKRYNPNSGIEELQIETIPRSSAAQRRGRCGRISDGVCLHLYSEYDLERAQPAADPEIRRSGLAGVILKMLELHLPRIDYFPFIDPPDASRIRDGWRTLRDLGAVNSDGKLTNTGRQLAKLPLDPPLGRMLLAAIDRKVWKEAAVTAGFLSIRDPLERPAEKRQAADEAHRRWLSPESDFLGIIKLWNDICDSGATASNGALRRFCRERFLNFNRIREWRNIIADLAETLRQPWQEEAVDAIHADAFHEALLCGVPRRIARYDVRKKCYLTSDSRPFVLSPGSGLAKRRPLPEWIFAFSIVETSRVFARQAAEIKPEMLERAAPELCRKVCSNGVFEASSGYVRATEKVIFGNFVIHPGRRIDYSKRDPEAARQIFIRDGLAAGAVNIPGSWVEKFLKNCRDLEALELKVRRPETILDREAAVEYFDRHLPESVNSVRSLTALINSGSGANRHFPPSPDDITQEQFIDFDPEDYPDKMHSGGAEFKLRYLFEPGDSNDGITMLVPEKELNILPPWAAEWLVQGYIGELAELILKKLPRDLRRECRPSACAAAFAQAVKAGKVETEQPFCEALADFAAEFAGVQIDHKQLENTERPEYLQLKIAVLNREGKVSKILREVPRNAAGDYRLRRSAGKSGKLQRQGLLCWEDDLVLPEEMALPGGRTVYPALYDEEKSAASGIFLRQLEAQFRHIDGLRRLFKIHNAEQCRYFRRRYNIYKDMKLSWFIGDDEARVREDMLDITISTALGDDLWQIRNADAFAAAMETAAQSLGEAAAAVEEELAKIFNAYSPITELIRRAGQRDSNRSAALEEHCDWLFAPRFILRPAVMDGSYRRYLRALKTRCERLLDNPARDAVKEEPLNEALDRFAAAFSDAPDLWRSPGLYDYWVLLEECRIACFAPEMPTAVRSPMKKLPSAWESLRY